jgi:AbrB family looped-hinge helix DNA binding protein
MDSYATVKGQVVIPSKLRRKFNIKAGTKIEFVDAGDYIRMQPITREYVHSLRGKYKGKGLLKALATEKKREREL